MSKYKIGDRIRHRISGETGTIRLIDSTSVPYGIEFDNEIQGLHSLQGICNKGHGLWVSEEDIELEKEVNSLDKERRLKMRNFKVGDRVKYIGTNSNYKGKVGTIVIIDDDSVPYGIEFDEKVYGGHSLDGECEYGYGEWVELEEIELINPILEDYTTEELERELKKRKEKEREEIIKELRKYIDKPVHLHEIPEYSLNFGFMLNDEDFNTYCKNRTTDELKKDLKLKKENKINEILEALNNNINRLRELGYTIPYKDNTTIDSLELNKALDSIGVFYE